MDIIKNNRYEIIGNVIFVKNHLNSTNLKLMTQKMVALRIKTIDLLEEITDLIYTDALHKHKYTLIYAQLCAYMINDSMFNKYTNSKVTFKKLLLNKCERMFLSYKTYQQDLEKLKNNFKHNTIPECMTPSIFKKELNNFLFVYYNKSLANCRFIGELFKHGVITEKIILSCITELLKENNEIQIHCLCIILQFVGLELSKNYNLEDAVNHCLLFKNENTIENDKLGSLILEIQDMYLNGWRKYKEQIQFDMPIYLDFESIPTKLKNNYELKSYAVMATCIFEECYDILFNYVNNKDFNKVLSIITNTNSWIQYDKISFVVTILLIASEEYQNIRTDARQLLNNLIMNKLLSIELVQLGVNKVLDELKMVLPDLPNILISNIINEFKF